MRLNIRNPSDKETNALSQAAAKKRDSLETIEEAWTRILSMKNSEADKRRLNEVKQAMSDGIIGREPESASKRFSKAEALRLWRKLDEINAKKRLQDMVDNTPDNYRLILDKRSFMDMFYEIAVEELIVFDVESTGVDVWSDRIVGHVLSATSTDMHYYIPIGHDDPTPQLEADWVNDQLRTIYEDKTIKKIAHNSKYDIQMLQRAGITLKGLYWDTLEAMKLLNENEPTYALKPLVSKYLRDKSYTYSELFGRGTGFDEIPLDVALAYAAKDGDITYKLYQFQRFHLEKHGNILEYFETVEMPLIPIVSEMEMNGYLIDREFAKEYGEELRKEAEASYAKVVEGLGDININSPAQLKTAIEEHIGNPIENTDAKQTLKPLSKEYPIIAELLNYREKNKLLSTYIDALPELIREASGRLHATFNQNGTKTGRFSSQNPNLQNQPSEARKMFKAPNGQYIVNADFSAQEVRIIASLSKEDVLLKAFAEGMDAYASLASEFFGKPYEECYKLPDGSDTPERKKMKVVLLMSMYGASKYGLAQALSIAPDEAAKFLDDFFKKYRKIDAFIKETQKFANRNGFVWIGDKQRKRRLPDARGNIRQYDPKRNRAMRQGPNARVQGLAAIQTKMTMLELNRLCKRKGWSMYFTIHDEVGLLVGDDLTAEDIADIDRVMTQTYLLDGVDNATDVEVQRRWGNSITAEEYLKGTIVPEL